MENRNYENDGKISLQYKYLPDIFFRKLIISNLIQSPRGSIEIFRRASSSSSPGTIRVHAKLNDESRARERNETRKPTGATVSLYKIEKRSVDTRGKRRKKKVNESCPSWNEVVG